MIGTMLVIAKQPRPGRVKTRLVPPYTHEQAAELAGAALRDTLAAADAVPARHHVLVFDGDPHDWLPPRWAAVPQVGGGLDLRLAAAFDRAPDGPAVLVGMDTPQLTPALLATVGTAGADAWFGPAADGGFWAVGFAAPRGAGDLIRGVPMSRADTGPVQLARLRSAGLRVGLLPALTDVDDAASAHAVAGAAPGTRFAAALRAIDGRAAARIGGV